MDKIYVVCHEEKWPNYYEEDNVETIREQIFESKEKAIKYVLESIEKKIQLYKNGYYEYSDWVFHPIPDENELAYFTYATGRVQHYIVHMSYKIHKYAILD